MKDSHVKSRLRTCRMPSICVLVGCSHAISIMNSWVETKTCLFPDTPGALGQARNGVTNLADLGVWGAEARTSDRTSTSPCYIVFFIVCTRPGRQSAHQARELNNAHKGNLFIACRVELPY